MFEFMSKALLSLVLDKRAREALETAKNTPTGLAAPPGTSPKLPMEPAPPPAMSEARRELIRNALAVQRSKQHVFDDLSEDAKAKLLITAVKALGIPPDQIERELRRPRPKSDPGRKH